MGKIILIALFILLSCTKTRAQNHWDSLGAGFPDPQGQLRFLYTDTVTNLLYAGNAASFMLDGFPIYGVASWNGTNWDSLGCGFKPSSGWWPSCAIRYNGLMYFGGNFISAGGKPIKRIATWDGVQWDSLPSSPNEMILDLEIYHGKLYACGVFNAIGSDTTLQYIARWNGTNWENVGNIMPMLDPNYANGSNPNFYSLCVYDDELYLAGSFYDSTGTPIHIIRWDDTDWKYVGSGIQEGGIALVNSMCVYNNELWVGGRFSAAATGTSNNITRWDGNQFQNVGGVGFDDVVYSFCIAKNKLWVGGNYNSINGIAATSLAFFDGQKWCTTGSNMAGSGILCIASYNDSLIVGGGLGVIDGNIYNHIAMWTGGDYSDSCMNANLSIDENNLNTQSELGIFPNPNNGNFQLELEATRNTNDEIGIFNLLGEKVFSKNISVTTGKNTFVLNVSGLTNGIYLIKLHNQNFSEKIVIQK